MSRPDKSMSADEAIAELEDGMTIGIGGWGSRRKPMALVRALLKSPLKDLTIVSYGGPDVGLAQLYIQEIHQSLRQLSAVELHHFGELVETKPLPPCVAEHQRQLPHRWLGGFPLVQLCELINGQVDRGVVA